MTGCCPNPLAIALRVMLPIILSPNEHIAPAVRTCRSSIYPPASPESPSGGRCRAGRTRNDRNSNAFQNPCEIRDQYPSKKCHLPIYLWASPFLGTSGHFWQANIDFYYFSSLGIPDISSRIFSKFSSSLPYSAQLPWRNQSLALL